MATYTAENCQRAVSSEWETVFCFWPICDCDGTWLILTDAERRALASGGYEYRALIHH